MQLHSVDNKKLLLEQQVKLPQQFLSSDAAFSFIQNIVPSLQEIGFLAASIDSVSIYDNSYDIFIFLGEQYKWAKVNFDSIPQGVMTQAGVKKEQWEGRVVHPRQIAGVSEKILQWAESNGYPFARVWINVSEMQTNGGVSGDFIFERGPLEKIDTVVVHGDVRVSRNYLLRYLDIKQGEYYNEKKLRGISNRVNELPFLKEANPWSVEFKLSGTTLNLYVEEKKANQINGIIGLLPNSVETGKFLLTVDALFAFQNILSQGESISLSYQNLQYKSPRLKADLVYPYLFNTPLGIDAHFDLFKKDTTFRRITFQGGIRYQFTPNDYIRIFYHNQSNRLITIDTGFVKSNKRLPDNVDVSANGLGAEIGLNRTDYKISPRRGWEARLGTSALLRQVTKSDAITGLTDATGFDYGALYGTLIRRRDQYSINGSFSYYLPVFKNVVFKTGYTGGWLSGDNLFRNELYQIGGFRLLRGFDEQSIFTNHYHVMSFEFRLLLDQNSYFYLFSDNGYVESSFNGFYRSDIYNGFGLGASLETKSGLFSISYALGTNSQQAIQLRQSKIHFGYIAYF